MTSPKILNSLLALCLVAMAILLGFLSAKPAGATFTQQAKLAPENGTPTAGFGRAVAISGDTAIIGAYEDTPVSPQSGFAFVMTRAGTSWEEQHRVTGGFAVGSAVAIDRDTVVIGDRWNNETDGAGAAYVLVRDGSAWTQQVTLRPSDGAQGDQFGHSVSVSGDTIVVGAPRDDDNDLSSGSAYVFVREGATWNQQAKIIGSDLGYWSQFGYSVSISGDTTVIGAPSFLGAAYVFERTETGWNDQAKLTSGKEEDLFGHSVSVNGDTAIVGAPSDSENGDDVGTAYAFARVGAGWHEQAKFEVNGGPFNRFGESVSISGDLALVGAPGDDGEGLNSGAAYLFGRSGVTWGQPEKIVGSDTTDWDLVGSAADIDGDSFIVGAPDGSSLSSSSGVAYVYIADFDADGVADTNDNCVSVANSDQTDSDACEAQPPLAVGGVTRLVDRSQPTASSGVGSMPEYTIVAVAAASAAGFTILLAGVALLLKRWRM